MTSCGIQMCVAIGAHAYMSLSGWCAGSSRYTRGATMLESAQRIQYDRTLWVEGSVCGGRAARYNALPHIYGWTTFDTLFKNKKSIR